MRRRTFTALITPMRSDCSTDWDGVEHLVESRLALARDGEGACRAERVLSPQLEHIQIDVEEGGVVRRSRNPVPIKAMMNLVGLPAGPCRPPQGRLTRAALHTAAEVVEQVRRTAPAVFAALPITVCPLEPDDPSLCYPERVAL